ncbi:MAG: hypothetical protein OEW05_12885 [Candidatus Aminicenantes bacterium]|nr:hypothetical protein [Candidatus Aminicenantes bacterium]
MSTETSTLTTVTPDDLVLVCRELEATPRPLTLHELTEKLAFEKTASQRLRDVKKYDPDCRYEVGDVIYKEYDETLTVGSKAAEHFQGAVILTVVGKQFYEHFHCEMLEVDYPGGGIFRKYVDYMKKTKTQVLLPSNCEGRAKEAEILEKENDPRLTELPMTERDLRTLEKALRSELAKAAAVFGWNDRWQLAAKRVDIPEAKVKEIEEGFVAAALSASTEVLVERHFGLPPSHDLFDLHCLSLSALLDKKYKRDFILLSFEAWGRWHLKRILNAMPEGLPVAAAPTKVPELEALEKPEMSVVTAFPIKVYLTWREILSGAVRLPRSLAKQLGHAREFVFTDPEENKSYLCTYFPARSFLLGLGEFYAAKNIPQGTSLTLEKTGPTAINFWIKKSKKKLVAPRLAYDSASDALQDTGEDVFTFAEPNKIIYIERETLGKLLPLAADRGDLDLRELLILIFKTRGLATSAREMHFLRAYHLVDVIRPTTQEDVEFTLLNSAEFSRAEKKGIFLYQEPYVPAEEEAALPAFAEMTEELAAAELAPEEAALAEVEAEAGRAGEFPEGEEREREVRAARMEREMPPGLPGERAKPAPAAPAKKEKPARKKPRTEGDRGLRPRKSERRVIEERITEEESEAEALSALKQKEEEAEDLRARERKKEEAKVETKEAPKFGGFFAEILKSALVKKKDEPPAPDDKDEKKEETPPAKD